MCRNRVPQVSNGTLIPCIVRSGNYNGGNCAGIGILTWRDTLSPRVTPYFRDTLKGLAVTTGGERERERPPHGPVVIWQLP